MYSDDRKCCEKRMTEAKTLKDSGLKESNGPWTKFVACNPVSMDGKLIGRTRRVMSIVDIGPKLLCADLRLVVFAPGKR